MRVIIAGEQGRITPGVWDRESLIWENDIKQLCFAFSRKAAVLSINLNGQ